MSNESNKSNIFWTSYADLLTSLFFVMLALYVVTFVILRNEQAKYKADSDKLKRLQQIETSVSNIDTSKKYFEYQQAFKKHILKVDVKFQTGSVKIADIQVDQREKLYEAGIMVKSLITRMNSEHKTDSIKYLVLIEGQASRDSFPNHEVSNYTLSYGRALSLLYYWKSRNVLIGENKLPNCELILAGSGEYGEPRSNVNEGNQRFLIHIIPKIGILR